MPLSKRTEEDAEIIASVFNEDVLRSMRMVMLGVSPTDNDKATVKAVFSDGQVHDLVKRRFLPELDRDTQIGEASDGWAKMEKMVAFQPKDLVRQALNYKSKSIALVKKMLDVLKDPHGLNIDLSYNPDEDEDGSNIMARNLTIEHIEKQLSMLWMIHESKKQKKTEGKGTK